MFMHYYLKFNYEIAKSFEEYYNEDLLNLLSIRGIECSKKPQEFQIFAYTFFFEMINELSKSNYKSLKKTYLSENLPDIKKNYSLSSFKDYLEIIKNMSFKSTINTCLKPLISTKERIVDMLVEITTNSSIEKKVSSYNSDINSNITIRSIDNSNYFNFFNNFNGFTKFNLLDNNVYSKNKNINTINIKNAQNNLLFSNNSNINNHIANTTSKDIFNSTNSINNTNYKSELMSKRIIGEVSKEVINEKEQEFQENIALKVDTLVDVILTQKNHKIHNLKNILCYIIEVSSDILRIFPEYEELPDNINLKAIIGARNVYFISLEVFFSVFDLYNINLNVIMQIFKTRYSCNDVIENPIKIFFKILMENFDGLETSNNGINNNKLSDEDNMKNSLNILEEQWELEINKKAKELTYYCKK